MGYRFIDANGDYGSKLLSYYGGFIVPDVGLTADVDVTALVKSAKECSLPFFLTFLHAAAVAAYSVKEFRTRIVDGRLAEVNVNATSHIVLLEDDTYCYCTLTHDMPFDEYIAYASFEQERSKTQRSLEDDMTLLPFYVSTLPWISYTQLTEPSDGSSNPHFTWGKYREVNGRLLMPLTVRAHHALVGGLQIGLFFRNLETEMQKIIDGDK